VSEASDQIKERLFNIKDLPTIPDLHSRILGVVEKGNYSVDDLSSMIERDQVLSGKVLKLVNSPYYSLYSKIASVNKAIVLLGANLIRGVILSTAIFDIAEKTLPGLWDHSYCCSMFAGFMANRLEMKNAGDVMTGALLHDIGKVLIRKQLPEESEEIYDLVQNNGITMRDAEKAVLGITHEEVGLWLADKWNFPRIIKDIISYHHSPGLCFDHKKETAIAHFADVVVKGVGITSAADPFVPPFDDNGFKALSLSDDDILDIMIEFVDIIESDKSFDQYATWKR
jgi:putative nucleotidyltransferase with HDIG domain